jgi:hypothetical protein
MPAAAPGQALTPCAPDQAATGSIQSDAHSPAGAPAPAPPQDAAVARGDLPVNAAEQAQPAAEASTLHRLAPESASAGGFGLQVCTLPSNVCYHACRACQKRQGASADELQI